MLKGVFIKYGVCKEYFECNFDLENTIAVNSVIKTDDMLHICGGSPLSNKGRGFRNWIWSH